MSDAPSAEDMRGLNDQAWAVIQRLYTLELSPDRAVLVLVLALAKFAAAVPAKYRKDHIEFITGALADMVPLTDIQPRYDA
jgi:hypothetical protein